MKCSSTEDAYYQLVTHDNDLKGFLAFAMLEEHKILSLKQLEETNTKITQKYRLFEWYQQQPATLFDGIKNKANNMAIDYAEGIADEFLYEIERNIGNLEKKFTDCESCVKTEVNELKGKITDYESSITKELNENHIACKKKHKFFPQFSINVLGGLAASLIAIIISFALTVYILYNRHKYDFTNIIVEEIQNELKKDNVSSNKNEAKKNERPTSQKNKHIN